ncbi:MAG TPA: hypothetical protein VEE85_00705 [Candidatus Bathyarchaeia archaeon]|nr:hypothetical protein [Candidatus Bathyarchaeia archaeon]
MSRNEVFGKTMWCAALAVYLLAGAATPARADGDKACPRLIRKAEESLEKAVRKHGEQSRQAEEHRRRLEEIRECCQAGGRICDPDQWVPRNFSPPLPSAEITMDAKKRACPC